MIRSFCALVTLNGFQRHQTAGFPGQSPYLKTFDGIGRFTHSNQDSGLRSFSEMGPVKSFWAFSSCENGIKWWIIPSPPSGFGSLLDLGGISLWSLQVFLFLPQSKNMDDYPMETLVSMRVNGECLRMISGIKVIFFNQLSTI